MSKSDATYNRYLECTSGGHNKFYDIWVQKEGQSWIVRAQYGKIGTEGRELRKGSSKYESTAINLANNLRNEKIAKGYQLANLPGSTKTTLKKKKAPKKVEQPTRKSISLERFAHILD